jgi:hypothetical protein
MKAMDRSVLFFFHNIFHRSSDDLAWMMLKPNLPTPRKKPTKPAKIPRTLVISLMMSKNDGGSIIPCTAGRVTDNHARCDMFNRAYTHISERIDQVYKDLTKGKASPMGGVAYLSLEDSEVCAECHLQSFGLTLTFYFFQGTVR